MTLPPIGTVESELSLSGSPNAQLGQNGQYLRAVSLHLEHDAIDELDIVLRAPNGSSLSLSTFQGIQIGQNITFDICFFNCNETPSPDPGFPAVFESDAGYEQNGFYTGSYYPAKGCLEELSGSLNGTWTLEIKDNFIQDGGKLLNWSLEFADNSGLDCIASCLPEICQPPETSIGFNMHSNCTGDQRLNLDIRPEFLHNPLNSAQFEYAYILLDPSTGLILEVLDKPDLRYLSPGIYLLYGIAYQPADWDKFPAPNGVYAFHNLIRDMNANKLCIRPSNDYRWVEILARPELANLSYPTNICPGDTIAYSIDNYDPSLTYDFQIKGGVYSITQSSDSVIQMVWFEQPDTFRVIITGGCDTLNQNIAVPLLNMPNYRVTGPDIACPGDTSLYVFSELSDTTFYYSVKVVGGDLISFKADSLFILWNRNKNQNQLCTQLNSDLCASLEKCVPVLVPDAQSDLINIQSDSLCPGSITKVWADSTLTNELRWTFNGAIAISDPADDTISIRILKSSDSASVCLKYRNQCGDSTIICQNIYVRKAPMTPGLEDVSSCQAGVFIESQLQNADSAFWTQLQGPSNIFLPPASPDSTLFELGASGNYQFALHAFHENCAISDTINIDLYDSPEIENIHAECQLDSFFVRFDIRNGSLPFVIQGDTIFERSIQTKFKPSGDTYQFRITDANQCSAELKGSKSCPCATYAEHQSLTPLSYCIEKSDPIEVPTTQDLILDGNDSLFYILHKEREDVLNSELMRSADGTFTFSDILEPGVEYYISIIAGNQAKGNIDLTDSCLYISQPRPLKIHLPTTIQAIDTLEACLNSEVEVIFQSSSEFPLEITLQSDQGRSKKVELTSPIQSVSFEVQAPKESWSVQSVNSQCPPIIEVGIQIIGIPPSSVDLNEQANICVGKHKPDTFNLANLFMRNPTQKGSWKTASSLNIQEDLLIVNPETDSGTYDLQFIPEQKSICSPNIQTVKLHIEICDCLPLQFPRQLPLCNMKQRVFLPDQMGVYIKGSWALDNLNSLENPPFIEGDYLYIDRSSPGEYEISFQPQAEDQFCSDEYNISLKIEAYKSAGLSVAVHSFCLDKNININLLDLIDGEDEGGQWFWQNKELSMPAILDTFSSGIHSFTYEHSGTETCPSSTTRLNIELIETPSLNYLVKDPKCFGEHSGSITLSSDDDLYLPHTYYLNAEASDTADFKNLPAGRYEIQMKNSKGCKSNPIQIELNQPKPFAIDLGTDLEIAAGNPFHLKLTLEKEDHQIDQIKWFENGTELENGTVRYLDHAVYQNAVISARATNHNGCHALDSVFINVKEPQVDISLPNVINPRSPNVMNRSFGLGKVQDVVWIESIQIFDRWGNQLFIQKEVEPGDPIGFWDGTVDGEYMQEGVYVYNIIYKTISGEQKSLNGDVSILY